jgi:hypothetical protein
MTAKLTKAYVTVQHRLEDVASRRDAGQGTLEYVGILVVIMLVFAAVWGAVNGQTGNVTSKVNELIGKFLNGTGGA